VNHDFGKVDKTVIDVFGSIAGSSNVITDREKLVDFCGDEFPLEEIRHFPDVVVKPTDTAQVSKSPHLRTRRGFR